MSEEMNMREAELNERALEGVSGGASDPLDRAIKLCQACRRSSNTSGTCNEEHKRDLRRYLEAHGPDSVHAPEQCPYYTR